MAGRADRRAEGVRALREAEDGGSHRRAGGAVAGRDVRIDGTWRAAALVGRDQVKFITIT